MALAVNRTGTVFKKCDRSNHKPETNKGCAAGTCQHSCDKPDRCPHAWTLRYWVNSKQVEKSFKDSVNENTGRVNYGSGKKLAQDFQLKLTVGKRAGDVVFADHSKSGKQNFAEAVEALISHMAVNDNSKQSYTYVYRNHVKPVFGDKTIAQVARDRDGVLEHLTVTMRDLSDTYRQQARMLIVGTCDEAVRSEKIGKHLLGGIELVTRGRMKLRTDFVFPTYEQVKIVAGGAEKGGRGMPVYGAGIVVWLMRGCGLRIEEALAVCKEDFIEDGTVLRVMWQAARDGSKRTPLKHRKQGEYRDVPVPSWLWEMVEDAPEGPLTPGLNGKPFKSYQVTFSRFKNAARAAGIPEDFTPHSLRHAYASAMLARGVPITELAHFLGHKDINITHSVYGHLLPSAAKRAVAALDAEYAEWSGAAE
jgi:integrase